MTIFANCHIFLKIVIFPKYDNKKIQCPPHLFGNTNQPHWFFFVVVIFGKYDNFQKNMTICKNCHIFIWQFEYDNFFKEIWKYDNMQYDNIFSKLMILLPSIFHKTCFVWMGILLFNRKIISSRWNSFCLGRIH